MPRLIKHIDKIAREKQRDVLYLGFRSQQSADENSWNLWNYEEALVPMRNEVCNWLTQNGIPWEPCAHFADECTICGYFGLIYLDVPYDDNNPQYQVVRDYLEFPDGSPRFATVGFWYLPLENAMENAHHDEPGFWDKWAETL